MGRNGKKSPVFPAMVEFVNNNVGKVVTSEDILLGKEPDRGAETSYLYKFVKLGHVEPIDNGKITDTNTKYKILKAFPTYYNSIMLKRDLQKLNGHTV